jgi:hypothetical protein
MIISLLIIVVLMIASAFVGLQLFDVYKSETARAYVVVSYGLFTVSLLFYWFFVDVLS